MFFIVDDDFIENTHETGMEYEKEKRTTKENTR